jgi:NitT/TauT family transport system substrate-binding protein
MKRISHRGAITLAATALLGMLVAACGSSNSVTVGSVDIPATPESGTVTLGTQPWIGYGPLTTIAPKQGIFAKNGLSDVKTVNFKSDKDINSALAGGQIDGASVGISQALTFAASGIPVKVVLLEDVSETADAILGRGVSSIADLRGKQVAVEEGTVGDMMLRYALKQNGMTIDDVHVVPLTAADAGTAIIAGKVDAAVTYEPYVSEAQAKDPEIKPIYTAGEREGLISDMLILRDDFIKNNPGQVEALVKSWGDAMDYYNANTSASQQLISQGLDSSYDELKTAFDGVKFFDLQQNQRQLNGPFPDLVDQVQAIMIDAKLLPNEVNVNDLIDPQFVDAALKQ